jgi:hypothetical protein
MRFISMLIAALDFIFCFQLANAQSRQLGSNLTEVIDYSPQLPFRDLFKISRDWFTQCQPGVDPGCSNSNSWDTGESALLDLDANGWVKTLPAQSASVVFTSAATFWDVPENFPSGNYVVTYQGQGSISYGLGATKNEALSIAGRDVVPINPSNGGILLRITATNPSNYIRNISFFKESDGEAINTEIFSEDFLNRISAYSVLRFMDWMRTNNSIVSTWSSRALNSNARFSSANGVPLETMISLSNKIDKAPWFNMPHQATTDYISNFAAIVRDSLEPGLNVYVEYSNEIWNPAFAQGNWVEEQAELEWPGGPASGFTKRINLYGKKSAETCDIWRTVFGSAANRVICVAASQAANSWTASEALDCPMWEEAPCYGHGISALAIAPYFGNYLGEYEHYATVKDWTTLADGGLSKLFEELSTGGNLVNGPSGGAIAQSFSWIEQNKVITTARDLDLITYEGGQHLVGVAEVADDIAITELFTSANRDPRMGSLYRLYLEGWNSRASSLFIHFTDISDYSRYGSWGAVEKIGQIISPKSEALMAYALGEDGPVVLSTKVKKSFGGKIRLVSQGTACSSFCQNSLVLNQTVTVRAKPAPGFQFMGWKGACAHKLSKCVINMTTDRKVTAVFGSK